MKIYIISDCHGNIDGLFRALEKKKLVDSSGNRIVGTDHFIVSIGDLANCVDDSVSGDIECLNLVGSIIDSMICGNHEIPYLDISNSFAGFSWNLDINDKIQTLMSEDFIGAAFLVGNTLISHAGLSVQFSNLEQTPEKIFNTIEDHWKAKNYNHSWFSSVGYARGGRHPIGGLFWCDFDNEFMPTLFPQIVGHTPKYVRMKDNALCIDVGAKDQDTEPFILELV